MNLSQTFKDLNRLRQLVDILFKHELGYLIEKFDLKHHLTFSKRTQLRKQLKPEEILPKHLRLVLEDMGGAFIKLGQLLSLREDLVPKEFARECSKLQDEVKPFPFEEVKEIIELELKQPLSKVFIKVLPKPIAAASVGQVHKAFLKNGKKVAIKVMRPNIKQIFETDIDLLKHLIPLLEKNYPGLKTFSPEKIIEEFEKYTTKELSYIQEGRNIDIFYKNFRKNKKVKVPKVYWDYTSDKVLTMEYIDGKKISEIDKEEFGKKRIKKVIKTAVDFFLEQIFVYGFFHADPHPGNIIIMKNDVVGLIDYGIVGGVKEDMKDKIEGLFVGLINGDKEMVANGFLELGIVPKETNEEELKNDISEDLGVYHNLPANEIKMSEAFGVIFHLARKYIMTLPQNLVLFMKAVITAEAFGERFDPTFNFIKVCNPYVKKIIKRKKDPNYIMATIKTPSARPQMSTVRPRSTMPAPKQEGRTGEIIRLEAPKPSLASRICRLNFTPNEEEQSLGEADVVVVVGRGIKKAENIALIRKLAEALGAALGATRDVIDRGWLSYPHQVGLSGQTINPKLYIGIGVSGAIQHLAGMQTAETIVAVNNDPNAQIFKVADFGIVGDLFDVVPALTKQISQRNARVK